MQTRPRHLVLKSLALIITLQPLNPHAVSSFGYRLAQEPGAAQTAPRRYLIKPLTLGATTDVHARSSRSLQVRVTDENDRPVPDLPLLFTLEAVGGPGNSGTLAGRLVPRGSPNAPGTTTAQAAPTQATAAQAEAGTSAARTEAQAPASSQARLESAEAEAASKSQSGTPQSNTTQPSTTQSNAAQSAQEPARPAQDAPAEASRGDRATPAQETDKSTSAKSGDADAAREASREEPGNNQVGQEKKEKNDDDDDDKGAVPPFLRLRARTNRQGIATVGFKAGDLAGPRVQVKVQVKDNDSVWQGLFSITPPSAIVGHIPKRALTERQWTTTDGKQISIGSLRGRVAVLHFFGSWCGYSKAQSRIFRPYTERGLPPELTILGLWVKDPRSNPELVRQYIADQGVTYPVVGPVEDKFFSQFVESRDISVPQTIILDREGRIIAHYNGYSEQINEEIKSLIEDVIYGGE